MKGYINETTQYGQKISIAGCVKRLLRGYLNLTLVIISIVIALNPDFMGISQSEIHTYLDNIYYHLYLIFWVICWAVFAIAVVDIAGFIITKFLYDSTNYHSKDYIIIDMRCLNFLLIRDACLYNRIIDFTKDGPVVDLKQFWQATSPYKKMSYERFYKYVEHMRYQGHLGQNIIENEFYL